MPASGCLMMFFFCLSLSVLSSSTQISKAGGEEEEEQARLFALQPCQLLYVMATISTPLYYGGLDNTGPHRVDLASMYAWYQLRLG